VFEVLGVVQSSFDSEFVWPVIIIAGFSGVELLPPMLFESLRWPDCRCDIIESAGVSNKVSSARSRDKVVKEL
jgi:hypothetical protein